MALNINGRMKVKTLKADFKAEFGLTLRVYDGRSFADDDATLASIRKGDNKGGEFGPRKNTHVGNLEDKIMEMFGIKTQVAGSDDSYLCNNDLTLAGALEEDAKKLEKKEKKNNKKSNDEDEIDDMNANQMQKYVISLNGEGQEFTLGFVDNTWGKENEGDVTYREDIIGADGDTHEWFEMDEIGHYFGPISDESEYSITNEKGESIFEDLPYLNSLLLGTVGLPKEKVSDYILRGINFQSGEMGLFEFEINEEFDPSRVVKLTVNLDALYNDNELVVAMGYVPVCSFEDSEDIENYLEEISNKIHVKGCIDISNMTDLLAKEYGFIIIDNEPDSFNTYETSVDVLSVATFS